jgi:group I intron endonuclease
MRYIYRITNLVNGKTYIGQHKVKKGRTITSDTYWGSGKIITESIKKYGKENFKKEILVSGDFTKEEINRFEICAIFFERLNHHSEYNISDGGEGGESCHSEIWYEANLKHLKDPEINKKKAETFKKTYLSMDKEKKEEWRKKNSDAHKGKQKWLGKHHTEESKKKIGLANSKSQKGSKNSQFGTHWYTNGEVNIKAKECPEGFRPGRI